ncbi:MAG: type II toxin-antitoxin system HicA family toxin [Thermomicrobiales bacterium]
MKAQKLYLKALSNPKGLRFEEALRLARAFGFTLDRIEGSHHILIHPQLQNRLNL